MSDKEVSGNESSDEYDCPSCDRTFDTDRGVKVHHSRAHGESIAGIEVECDVCGTTITRQKSRLEYYDTHHCEDCMDEGKRNRVTIECAYCGKEGTRIQSYAETHERTFCKDTDCRSKWMSKNRSRENHPRWQDDVPRNVNCTNCDVTLSRPPSRIIGRSDHFFCSTGEGSCEQEWKRENTPKGEDHHFYDKVDEHCAWCDAVIPVRRYYSQLVDKTFCRGTDCQARWCHENLAAEGERRYGVGWSEEVREEVRKSQDRVCAGCPMTGEEHLQKYGKRLNVHHIMKARAFDNGRDDEKNARDNLVALCSPCHVEWEKMSPLRPLTS